MAAWRESEVADLAVEQAEVNIKEETDKHTNGLVTLSDVLDAQVSQRGALDRRTDARSDYWLKRFAYLRAAGREP